MIQDLSDSLRRILDAPKKAPDLAALYENGEPLKLSPQDAKPLLENFGTALNQVASAYLQSKQSNQLRALIDVLRRGNEPPVTKELTKQIIDNFKQAALELEPVFSAPDADPQTRGERVLRFAAFMSSFWELRGATISLQRLSDIKPETNNTVNLFLYDIKENLELRNNEPVIRRGNGQVNLVRAPMRLACSYLITAWTAGDQEDALLLEQQLLSQALQLLSRHAFVPEAFLQGSLKGSQEPLPPMVTMQAESLKHSSEFWAAVQQKLRPAINVMATISMQPFEAQAERLVTRPPEIDFSLPPPPHIEGRITTHDGQPVARALVSLVETDETTATDFKGRYRFNAAQTARAYTLRIRVADAQGFRIGNVTLSTSEKRDKDSTTPYLHVRVTDEKGNPVKDVVVTVVELGPGKAVDAEGKAEFLRVPPRAYGLRIESQNLMLETNVIVPQART